MKNWFEKLVSIDELKVSLLAISLIGVLILDGYMALVYHDVPPQLTTITIVIVSALAGFNAINVVAGNISANRNGQTPVQTGYYNNNTYGMNANYNQNYNPSSNMINGSAMTSNSTIQPATQTATNNQIMPKM